MPHNLSASRGKINAEISSFVHHFVHQGPNPRQKSQQQFPPYTRQHAEKKVVIEHDKEIIIVVMSIARLLVIILNDHLVPVYRYLSRSSLPRLAGLPCHLFCRIAFK